jgi:hypothetical protein
VPIDIAAATPSARLESILRETTVRCFTTFFAVTPVVCFTESTVAGLEYLIADAGFQPWGIVFHRQLVFDHGGGPVFHVRGDDWPAVQAALSPTLRSRTIRFQPGDSEWVEEREWRIVYDEGAHGFEFDPATVAALIVGENNWPPWEQSPHAVLFDDLIGSQMLEPPEWLPHCPIWIWNADERHLLVSE